MTSTWRILLLSLAFFAVVGLSMWAALACHPEDDRQGGNGYKRLSGTVAEGLVYRVGRERHPRITCSACRVGKMKLGMISLGAFNTVELDDLVINVPEWTADPLKRKPSKEVKGNSEADAVVDALNLRPVVAMAHVKAKKFASIRISRLQINRMSGERLLPILKAESLKSSGRRMTLQNVVLYRDGQELALQAAELEARPRFRLVWPDGAWDLTDALKPVF